MWLLLVVAAVHLPSLFLPFFIDDYVYLDAVRKLKWPDVPGLFLSATMDHDASGVWWTPYGLLPFYRPAAILSFALDFQFWGANPFGFHLSNLLLHLLSTHLVYQLARRLISAQRFAVIAAGTFALHPIHTEALGWISGRFDLLACACVCGSVIAYCNGRHADRYRRPWLTLCVLLFAIGLACKETAIVLPVMIVVAEWLRRDRPGFRTANRPPFAAFAAMAVVTVVYIAIRFRIFGGLGSLPPPYGVDLSSPAAIWRIPFNAAQYLLGFVLLIQVDAIYLNAFWETYPVLLAGLSAIALALIGWAWRIARSESAACLGIVWTILFTGPALAAMPGERNVYLASVGFALLLASLVAALVRRWHDRPHALRRVTRAVNFYGALFIVILFAEAVLMVRIGQAANSVFQQLRAVLPDPPPNARIYVVNQCPLNAVGFTQGVRILYNRDDIVACALTVAPQFQGRTRDTVHRISPDTVRLQRDRGGFFDSFLERFLTFSAPWPMLVAAAGRVDLHIVAPVERRDPVTSIEIRLPLPLDDPRLFLFEWDNSGVRTLSDVIWRATPPALIRCPVNAPTSTAATP
ncbi:MAG: hypothetical protein HOP29_09630 [Phycisphaerales bacterium]|nr:hypothetical protein [Phycisphaerales bacterium]